MKKHLKPLLALLAGLLSAGCGSPFEPARPTPEQLAFQEMELGAFIHFSIDAFVTDGSNRGSTPASAFNPTQLDVEQWVRTAKEMGAQFAVLTARHEQGFCLWPTQTTDYSIKNSPYRDGKGDIVREFVDACRKYGIRPGLYTAPWIDSNWEARQPEFVDSGDTGDVTKFNNEELFKRVCEKERRQITELLTNYGELVFIWDDHFGRSDVMSDQPRGGNLRKLYTEVNQLVHELQPSCLILGRDIEHVGNERGEASYPLWNSLNTLDSTLYTVSDTYGWEKPNTGNPCGRFYRPQLSCTTDALSSGGWMWHGYRTPTPLEQTMKVYYETVGRGASLIINFAPDTRGLIEQQVVDAAVAFGDEIERRFASPLLTSNGTQTEQTLSLAPGTAFNHLVLMEDLTDGQRIAAFTVEVCRDGVWSEIVRGETIGHKRIVDLGQTLQADALRFKVIESTAPARMRRISLYDITR